MEVIFFPPNPELFFSPKTHSWPESLRRWEKGGKEEKSRVRSGAELFPIPFIPLRSALSGHKFAKSKLVPPTYRKRYMMIMMMMMVTTTLGANQVS